ncbi:MAG: DUF3108 domain-containing protein [bacterium]
MKIILPVALLLVVFAGCPKPAAPAELALDPPAWAGTEINQYLLIVGDDTVGSHITQLRRVDYEDQPALNLVVETMASAGGADSHDSAWSMLRLDDLRPLRSVRNVANADIRAGADLTYDKDSVRALALTPQGPRGISIALEPRDYDNDQITTLLRALPLAADTPAAFNVVIGIGGAKVAAEASLVGTETVTVPLGTFECRRVRLALAGQSVDIWYETSGIRRMVRYAAPAADLALELAASIVD